MLCRSARGAKPLEVIGTYNPIPKVPTNVYDEIPNARPYKDIALDRTRAKYWLGVGAQPSESVWKLMSMVSWVVFFVQSSWDEMVDCSDFICTASSLVSREDLWIV